MSTKIEGVFPHDLNSFEDVERLPKRLHPTMEGVIPIYRDYWMRSVSAENSAQLAWYIGLRGPPSCGLTPRQQWELGKGPMLFAPQASIADSPFHLILGRRSLFATTGVKWWVAMDRPALLLEVRDYFRWLASALNSHAFILYRQDGGLTWDRVLEGMTLEEIEREKTRGGAERADEIEALKHSNKEILKSSYYREG
jgi:hypothetical protein